MKIKSTSTAIALTLGLAASANAALSYTYNYDDAPGVENGAIDAYEDDAAGFLHTDTNTAFTSGDLNDLAFYSGANPVTDDPNSMVGWVTAASITIDLGGLFDLTSVDISSYGFPPFNVGRADDVTISTSVDNVTYGVGTLHLLTDTDTTQVVARTDTGVRYIQLSFDGDSHTGDKWALNELAVEGTAVVPEPSSTALLGLGGLALILRRRK